MPKQRTDLTPKLGNCPASAPHLQLAGLSLWILGREFPNSNDFWDGNWLNVLAHVAADGAIVEVSGPILHGSELASFADELQALHQSLNGQASLGGQLEPNLRVEIAVTSLGHLAVTVTVSPNPLRQKHEFNFDRDQTDIQPLIAACRNILSDYPLKDMRI